MEEDPNDFGDDVTIENLENEENDEGMENAGENTIVIHPGSLHLRIGRACDPSAVTIPHCIAWKNKQGNTAITPWLQRPETEHSEFTTRLFGGARIALEQLAALAASRGTRRQASSTRELTGHNQTMKPERTEVQSQLTWTDTTGANTDGQAPEYVIGDEALYLEPVSSGYQIVWPFAYGELDIKPHPHYTQTALLSSVEKLWSEAIRLYLDIQPEEFKTLRCMLLIPDRFSRHHINLMISILLDQLNFSHVQVIQESVCSSFGAGVASACVVDVGDHKTSISCVEDGISLPQTRVTLHYGGRDITRVFSRLIKNISFPYRSCKPERNMLDALLLQELKHTYCNMDTDSGSGTACVQEMHFQTRPPGSVIIKYSMKVGDEMIIPTLAFFYPQMFAIIKANRKLVSCGVDKDSISSDIFDSDYIIQTRSRQEESARNLSAKKRQLNEVGDSVLDTPDAQTATHDTTGDLEGGDLVVDEDVKPATPVISTSASRRPVSTPIIPSSNEENGGDNSLSGDQVLALDEAIVWSISRCSSEDVRQRMLSCILVVGGGLMFEGVESLLQYRLWLQLQASNPNLAEHIAVITKSKDIDPQCIAWKGGCIVALLSSTDEHWISSQEWTETGSKIIHEKSPFNY